MPHADREAITRNRWGIECAQYYVQWGEKIVLFLRAQNTYDKWNAVRLTADTKEDINELHAKKSCATRIVFMSPEDHLIVSKREFSVKNRLSSGKKRSNFYIPKHTTEIRRLNFFVPCNGAHVDCIPNTTAKMNQAKKKNQITVGIGISNVLVDTQ